MNTDEKHQYPAVEIVTLLYNSERFIERYLCAIAGLVYPADKLRVWLVDNDSSDDTTTRVTMVLKQYKEFPIEVHLIRSTKNMGFAGGNNLVLRRLMRESQAKHFLVINPDTEIDANCLQLLIAETRGGGRRIGMLEARQTPREHPKWYDRETLETGWCSGGGVLINADALWEVGLFDDHFFLYAEDVDLSWRMWLHGWSCKIVPGATYTHITEELDGERDHRIRHYYNFRNGLLMHFKYDSLRGIVRHYRLMAQTIANCGDSAVKARLRQARWDAHKKLLPMLWSRLRLQRLLPNRWIVFNGFDYEVRRPFKDFDDGERRFYNSWDEAQAANQ